jgi:hypothetical protein
MPNLIYEGQVKVYDKKANGDPLIIGKGDRQGEPYYKLSFKVGGEYVNLMDFEGVTGGSSGAFFVEYYQKFLPNGEPDLYNEKPQYQLVDIVPLGATQTASPAPSGASEKKEPYNAGLGAYQTALNCSTQLAVALIAAHGIAPDFDPVPGILTNADTFHTYLTTGAAPNELDQMLAKAKSTFEDAPIGFDDKPDPDGSEEFGL